MHTEYPNDNIRSLLRPGDSLVRRQFEFIPSWDQSFFYQPCTPCGCYTKLPCSQCVKHIVRQWLFVNSVVVLWGWESLWVYGAAQQSQQNKGLFWTPMVVCWDCFYQQNRRNTFLGDAAFSAIWVGFSPRYRRNRWNSLPGSNAEAPISQHSSRQTGSQLLSRDEGQKVGLLSCFLAFTGSVCDANADASDNGSLAFQENCFSAFAGLLPWLLWV